MKHYAAHFDTVELNTTFYGSPNRATVEGWHRLVPANFIFSWKANKYITHLKRLADVQDSLHRLNEEVKPLADVGQLGPILFQLPPKFDLDLDRLKRFVDWLPPARQHVIEFRNPGWWTASVAEVLKDHNIAWCLSDHSDCPSEMVPRTASFLYIRLHGPTGQYAGRYSRQYRRGLQSALALLDRDEAYVYFDNDSGGAAPLDARSLLKMLGDYRYGDV